MDETTLKEFAKQLRKPEGQFGLEVGEKMNKGNVHMNRLTIEALQVVADDNILEIGMGNGFFVGEILKKDPTVTYTGCDYSSLMVEASEKLNAPFVKSKRAEFFLATADKLPFKNETFSKVFTVNTLYFWEDHAMVLAEIHRVLKPKGKLFIAIRPKALMQHYPFVKYGFTMFSADEVTDLLHKNKFMVTDTFEKPEPEQEINGEKVRVSTLIVIAQRQ